MGETCVKPAPDKEDAPCVYIGTQNVCAKDEDNCVFQGGKFQCLQEKETQPPGSLCYTVNAKLYCLTTQPEIKTEHSVVTNPDGSTTTTETTKPGIKGASPQTRTTTQTANGAKTTTSNYLSDISQVFNYSAAQQSQNVDLSQVNLNTANTAKNTKDLFDKFNEFMGSASDYSNTTFDHSGLDASKAADEGELNSFIQGANPFQSYYDSHSFVSALMPFFPTNTGACTGGIHREIFGKQFDFEPCDKLLPLREILAWFFAVITAWQLVNISTRTLTR
ncbi:hypothetical protein AYM39_11165 [Methylomonas sp. DH-1]|nr:hypothetical protein AYM39_11165 [Methylomonas sp. DH-1]